MTSRRAVDELTAQESLAVVGVARSGTGFGNAAVREVRANGRRLGPGIRRMPGCPTA
jgi:hypothetical protein